MDDVLGWVASLLTLITFAQSSMIPLRVTAILANIFFISYGAIGHVLPVLTLHVILLPLNSARLAAQFRGLAAWPVLATCLRFAPAWRPRRLNDA